MWMRSSPTRLTSCAVTLWHIDIQWYKLAPFGIVKKTFSFTAYLNTSKYPKKIS